MNSNFARTASRFALGVLMLTSLPGCFSLGRTSPTLEQYVIGGAAPTDTMVQIAALDGVSVGLRRIDLAPYLASSAIVVRRGSHEILTSDFHRWGEDPADGINRAIARHLAAAAPFGAVDVAPWPVRTPYDYLIQFHITRFEGVVPGESSPTGETTAGAGEGVANVHASWRIIRQQDETVLARGDSEHTEEGWRVGDYAALVALLDEGLAVVAREVAVAVGGLAAGGSADAGSSGDSRQ